VSSPEEAHHFLKPALSCLKDPFSLTDCGTNQPEIVEQLQRSNIDTIILDHHQPKDPARPLALINPQCGSSAVGKELCSAGLAFKLAQALFHRDSQQYRVFLDLAAIGTLADYAPLRGENRILVQEGLQALPQTTRPGLQRLMADLEITTPRPDTLIKRLIPRLNSAGRLGDASAVWQMLRQHASAIHETWAEAVEVAHHRTKHLHRQALAQAIEQVDRLHFRDQHVVVVSRRGWPQGLMGPLATQLVKRFERPAIAIATHAGQGVGSVRSVPLLNMLEILEQCRGMLTRFGGHAQACGITLEEHQIEPFRHLVNQQVGSIRLQHSGAAEVFDLELTADELTPDWVQQLDDLAPHGAGNPHPCVVLRQVRLQPRSPRRAEAVLGGRSFLLKGEVPTAGLYYDLVVSPAVEKGAITLTLRNIRESDEQPW
jgi:single-stranded-DNA-specific exonuclease